ncbi:MULTISPECIES: hypothetical protein [Acidianus]|nr:MULTISPECIES: hypothetical protein [Acidianus]
MKKPLTLLEIALLVISALVIIAGGVFFAIGIPHTTHTTPTSSTSSYSTSSSSTSTQSSSTSSSSPVWGG